MEGWIQLHRRICEHWLWEDKPFSRGQAFIDLILSANHSDKTIAVGDELIIVKRGSFITSQIKLAARWGWSKTKVMTFLRLLEKDKMIQLKSDRKKTTVNIVNYSKYQVSEIEKKPQKSHRKATEKPQKNTNNNDNNDNNDKNDNIPPLPPKGSAGQPPVKNHFAEFVTMTNDEYKSLIERYGKDDTNRLVEILDNYKGSTGKRYKSDYRAILSWCIKRLEEEKACGQQEPTIYTDNYNHDALENIIRAKLEGRDEQ